jgi:hypothetical protein
MKALQQFNKLATEKKQAKYPGVPAAYIPPAKYKDKTANDLTNAIIAFLRFNGHQAERISVVSRKVNGKYVFSNMQRGSADIAAVLAPAGLSIKIEVKIKYDKQSEYQKKYQQQVEAAGGLYFIAKSFEEFYHWYESIKKEG